MQAHTGSLLECVRSLGSCESPFPTITAAPPPPPFRGALYGVHAEHKAPGTRERFCSSGFSLPYTCIGLRFSRARAHTCASACPLRASARIPPDRSLRVNVCVYGFLYLHRNRGSIEPRKWPWNSHSWKVNSPTASRGAPRSSLKVRKVRGRPGETDGMRKDRRSAAAE